MKVNFFCIFFDFFHLVLYKHATHPDGVSVEINVCLLYSRLGVFCVLTWPHREILLLLHFLFPIHIYVTGETLFYMFVWNFHILQLRKNKNRHRMLGPIDNDSVVHSCLNDTCIFYSYNIAIQIVFCQTVGFSVWHTYIEHFLLSDRFAIFQ